MKFIIALFLGISALAAAPALAQSDTNMKILLEKVKSDKKLVVAAGMELNDAEGKAFWPIYDAYQNDLKVINTRLAKAILAYADAYDKNTLTDAQAKVLGNEAIAVDQAEVTLRKTYSARLGKVLPARKVVRYMQIENKIRAAIRYELAIDIPLVPGTIGGL